MGLAAASSTLALGAPKPVAALPASHPWQARPALHIGVRTGFCGSMTTLSGWALALVQQLVGGGGRLGGRWPQWLWGWVVGAASALASYALGEHVARLLDDRLRPEHARPAARAAAAAARSPAGEHLIGERHSGVFFASDDEEEGLPDPAAAEAGRALVARGEATLSVGAIAAAARAAGMVMAEAPAARPPPASAPAVEGDAPTVPRRAPRAAAAGDGAAAATPSAPPSRRRQWRLSRPSLPHGVTKTEAVVATAGAACLAAAATLTALDGHPVRRGVWAAVLVSPVGALVRWGLSPLNYSLPGRARFLPTGTLAANMAGCALTYAVAAALAVSPPAPGSAASIVAAALQLGVAGALSTVSTLAAELTAMLRTAPAHVGGYAYGAVSWAGAQVLGVAIYGAAVWATNAVA